MFANEGQDFTVETNEGKKGDQNFIFDIPRGEENALVFKLLQMEEFNGAIIKEIEYFQHRIGTKPEDIRSHVSSKSVGLGDSPEEDFMWEVRKSMKKLKDAGQKESPEYEKLKQLNFFFSPKSKFYALILQPNSSQPKVVQFGQQVVNQLIGKEATEMKQAIPSLVENMKKRGLSPVVQKKLDANKVGWLKLWKTGEKLGTEYHLKIAQTEVTDGFDTTLKMQEFTLSDEIISALKGEKAFDKSKVPGILEMLKKGAWIREESDKLVKERGGLTGTPDRCLKRADGDTGYRTKAESTPQVEIHLDDASSDDIPF